VAHIQIAMFSTNIIDIFSLCFIALYLICFLIILLGWFKQNSNVSELLNASSTISIIIASRNEEKNLPCLIKDLEKQSYFQDKIEVIIVDDHSEIPVKNLDAVLKSPLLNLHILELSGNHSGKKSALLKGAQSSLSEVLLFTDADCRVGENWISSYLQFYEDKKPDLIIGLVDLTITRKIIEIFARLEQIALTLTGAGTALMQHATMCNGANLCVKRSTYLEVIHEFKHDTPSGDDVFLLHAIKKREKARIEVITDKKSIVRTNPPFTLRQLLHQKARWTSKSARYNDADTIILALIILLNNVMLVLSFLGFVILQNNWKIFATVILIKTITDCLVIAVGLNFFRGMWQLLLIPLFEIIYPFYVLVVVFQGAIKGFCWKDRRISTI
jgi:biofilm PGA synthesis N-glycosyltransferase PgaC